MVCFLFLFWVFGGVFLFVFVFEDVKLAGLWPGTGSFSKLTSKTVEAQQNLNV